MFAGVFVLPLGLLLFGTSFEHIQKLWSNAGIILSVYRLECGKASFLDCAGHCTRLISS